MSPPSFFHFLFLSHVVCATRVNRNLYFFASSSFLFLIFFVFFSIFFLFSFLGFAQQGEIRVCKVLDLEDIGENYVWLKKYY